MAILTDAKTKIGTAEELITYLRALPKDAEFQGDIQDASKILMELIKVLRTDRDEGLITVS